MDTEICPNCDGVGIFLEGDGCSKQCKRCDGGGKVKAQTIDKWESKKWRYESEDSREIRV